MGFYAHTRPKGQQKCLISKIYLKTEWMGIQQGFFCLK
jgi:hypothetical protein